MNDVGTPPATDDADVATSRGPGRRIRRHRGLPGGRAVVGALLVAVAAVGVFAAYLDATAKPTTRYLVASGPVAPGTLIQDRPMALELFSAAPIELQAPVDERVLRVEEIDALVGRKVLAPLARGELLQRSALLEVEGTGDAQIMSVSVPRPAAVAGDLMPGEVIDVLATYTVGGVAFTSYVARGVPLVALDEGSGDSVVLTVSLRDLEDVQAVGHAANSAAVFVTRSPAADDGSAVMPEPYAPAAGAADGGAR